MAWLSSYGPDNKITDEYNSHPGTSWTRSGTTWVPHMRIDTEEKYRYMSMTYAAAQTCVAELQAACPAGTTRTVCAKRQNDADAWYVEVFDIVIGTWDPEEE
jgi:hypothetical protein